MTLIAYDALAEESWSRLQHSGDDPNDPMAANNDVVEWWDDETEDGTQRMSQLTVVPDNITVNRNGPLADDEPFAPVKLIQHRGG